MTQHNLKEYTKFAHKLADKSGKTLKKYYRNLPGVSDKKDKTPVTVADIEVEQALRGMIEKKYPLHGIMGEEQGATNASADYCWLLDPIDGTKSFMIGRPLFGTLISLCYKNEPILGIINQPITKDRWVGVKDKKTKRNKKKLNTSQINVLKDATLCSTGPNYFTAKELTKFNTVAKKTKYTIYGGDCYNYGLLALGTVDLVIEAGMKPHDYCALIPIIEGAGGVITDWNGQPVTTQSNGTLLAAANKELHSQALSVLNNKA